MGRKRMFISAIVHNQGEVACSDEREEPRSRFASYQTALLLPHRRAPIHARLPQVASVLIN